MTDHDDLVTRNLASLGEEADGGAAERRKDRFKAAVARLKTDTAEMARIDAIAAGTDIEDLTDEPPSATSVAPRPRWLQLVSGSPQEEDLTDEPPSATSVAPRSRWRQQAAGSPQGGAAAICLVSEPLLTPAEVATMFRVDPKTVTRWAKAGKLTSIRTLGGHRRYREIEVRALLAGIPQHRSE
jgi:excisionase family DNA binding protein